MCDEEYSPQDTIQIEAETAKDKVQIISVINEDVQGPYKQKSQKNNPEIYKVEDIVKTDNIYKPQTVWVQFQFGGSPGNADFDYDPSTRNSFIKIVFLIVFVMLLITAGFTAFVYMTPDLRKLFRANAMIISIGCCIVMICLSLVISCLAVARRPPCNFVCLFLALIAMTTLCAAVTAMYNTQLIVFALISTMIVVIVCILLACSSFDFTKFAIFVVTIATAFFAISTLISLALLVMKMKIPILQLVMLVIGTLIQTIMLIMELQAILGGKTIEMDENAYVLAAYMLYTSIVDLFIRFLQICGILDTFTD